MPPARPCEWLAVPADHPFGLQTLPYGSFSQAHHPARRRVGVAIGDRVLDLTTATERLMPGRAAEFSSGALDHFLAVGDGAWAQVRTALTDWLSQDHFRSAIEDLLVPADSVTMHLPFTVADYVDFYASQTHATNVGRMFRPGGEPLTPNWKHLPIGYHGRAGTVVVSGTEVRRPSGQARGVDGSIVFGPSQRLDFEAEVGFVVGTGSALGSPLAVAEFAEHVFGVCLLNDWSARDIQAWEYVPLGPFLGKSFATSVSAWITPLAALAGAWVPPPLRDPQPLPYLDDSAVASGLDLSIEVGLNGAVISRPPFATMYWTPAQMLAHLSVNGASVRPGDLFASGTVSGTDRSQWGSLLELAWNGAEPLTLADGTQRTFLEDGDEVVLTASAPSPGGRIALGEVRGRVVGGS
ncbi:MAG: fumarylacetoacetase [Candidatus Nephthysia bennettiae]|nr:MAG: fumarylacetoacetase [Candidatus Dormibacteraeota bacterium]